MIKNNWIYVQFVVLIIRSCQNKSTLLERSTVIDCWLVSEIMAKGRELYNLRFPREQFLRFSLYKQIIW